MSRAPGELGKQCEDLNQKMKDLAMAISGPYAYPRWVHCTHCVKSVTGWGMRCREYGCLCLPDHVPDCECHGDYGKWCEVREIYDWLNGLTNRPTPVILTRVTS